MPRLIAALCMIVLVGCGGGSGGTTSSAPQGSPSLQVLPASFDFGTVTTNNSPAPLEITIQNNGSASLTVSSITLSDQINFSIDASAGTRPCGALSGTIAAGDQCNLQVNFQPTSSSTFSANVQINSNDGSSPHLTIALAGVSEPVATLSVRINQIETACPSDLTTAYVSVIDQGGYPLPGLLIGNFSVVENVTTLPVINSTYVEIAYQLIAISGVMDYSGTMTDQPVAVSDMETGFTSLFNGMRTGDVGEVIKFDSEVQVVQPFTTDKAALTAAVSAPFDLGRNTHLYDAVFQAIDDTALQTSYRRAVVVATDGVDEGPSTHTLNDVISNATAKGVPVFTIGIGANVDAAVLGQMASDTGGQFFTAEASQNLATIYRQLSSVLYERQYILTFDQLQLGAAGTTAQLMIQATSPQAISGNDTILITSCQ